MTNKYRPHLHILPEDDANREMANGFLLEDRVLERNVQVLKPAGGWPKVLESIEDCGLENVPERRLLLLIDFDDQFEGRMKVVQKRIPDQLKDRIYVLGVLSEPEGLKVALTGKSLEDIGSDAAKDCIDEGGFWKHPLIKHNSLEVSRLKKDVVNFILKKA